MAADWYVRVNNVERGPIESGTLKQLALEGRITPKTPIRKGASGDWVSAAHVKGLFPPVAEQTLPQPAAQHQPAAQNERATQHQPPPLPTPAAIPTPKVIPSAPQDSEVRWSVPEPAKPTPRPPLDVYQVVLLSIGALCLAILAISPCLTWVTIMGGGMLGIDGDGKLLLFITLGLGIGLGVELLINKRAVTSVLLAQWWGTFAAFWMAGQVWRVVAMRQSPEMRDNMFGSMMALQVTPGAGLFVGLLSGVGVAIVFAILAIQCLKKPYGFAISQTLSVVVGIAIAVMLGHQGNLPSKPKPSEPSLAGLADLTGESTPSSPSSKTAPPAESPATRQGETVVLDQVKVTPKMVELRKVRNTHNEQETKEPVLVLTLVVENISQGQVFSPYAFASGKDNFGNALQKVGGGYGSFSPDGSAAYDDLKPGQKAVVLVCLEPKMETATSYMWEVSQKCNNQEHGIQSWTLKFDASEISRPKPGRAGTTGTTPPSQSASSSDDEWTDAQKPFQQGNVQIEVTGLFVGKVPLKTLGDEGESQDALCQIGLRITNRGATSKIDYQGWQGNSFSSDARLTDDVGNRYKGVNFGIGTHVVGQLKSESIYPGKSIEEVLVFEAPVEAAKYLNLELPAKNIGEKGTVRLRIPRTFSSKQKDRSPR